MNIYDSFNSIFNCFFFSSIVLVSNWMAELGTVFPPSGPNVLTLRRTPGRWSLPTAPQTISPRLKGTNLLLSTGIMVFEMVWFHGYGLLHIGPDKPYGMMCTNLKTCGRLVIEAAHGENRKY